MLIYGTHGPIATITLNRPERLNTIVPPMPDEFEAAINEAMRDDAVKVIVLRGAGRAFCAGYDFGGGFQHWDRYITTDGRWDPGKDFAFSTAPQIAPTQKFMSMWRASKMVLMVTLKAAALEGAKGKKVHIHCAVNYHHGDG